MQSTSTTRVSVEPGGTGVAAHVGLHALGTLADQLGLGASLSARVTPQGERMPLHDRGKVLVQMALVLAGGGESCSDIEHLRAQSDLFGSVPSDTTVFRTFQELHRSARSELAPALAEVRAKVWSKVDTHRSAPVILDIDASIVEIHSESKEMAEPTYKGGFGFHPMFCFSDLTGEALSSVLRAGNAGANTVADHVTVLDRAIDQLPSRIAKGHRAGDDAASTSRQVIVRADSAGCTTGFLEACRERNVSFFVTVRANAQLESAIHETSVVDSMWTPSVTQDGTLRDGACGLRGDRAHRHARSPYGHSLHHSQRAPAPRGPAQPVSLARVPLLGLLHRLRRRPRRARQDDARARARREPHPTSEGLGALSHALHELRGEQHVAPGSDDGSRPRQVVPAALPGRQVARRSPEGPSLGALSRTGPPCEKCTQPHRATPRRMADGHGAARCLPAHRTAHLTFVTVPRDRTDVPLHVRTRVTSQK